MSYKETGLTECERWKSGKRSESPFMPILCKRENRGRNYRRTIRLREVDGESDFGHTGFQVHERQSRDIKQDSRA